MNSRQSKRGGLRGLGVDGVGNAVGQPEAAFAFVMAVTGIAVFKCFLSGLVARILKFTIRKVAVWIVNPDLKFGFASVLVS